MRFAAPRRRRALLSACSPQLMTRRRLAATSRFEQLRGEIDDALANVRSIDDDRILRRLRSLVEAILRTNAFAPAAEEALAFKINSSLVPGLPAPVPWREIWVYSPRVEGIHLRGGPVARGGLRWSDRRDDFRTEILGLMKAQLVKNAVIVPTGAKGGFYPKQLPPMSNRDAWLAEGTESYKIFIRSLLSVTDNLVNDKVVHPEQVVIHDGEDPYFVVAADKGTATFSDVANAIALERNFWLGDAFASGGSNGYDHKAMGITAQGRVDLRPASFPGNGNRRSIGPDPGRGLRRHVRRRVRQRHAAVEVDQAGRRVRSSPHLHRPQARCRRELEGTQASVRAAALELGRLRQEAHFQGRRRVRPHGEVDHAERRGAGRARYRHQDGRADDADQRHSEEPGGPVLVRRDRHLCQGIDAEPTHEVGDPSNDALRADASELRAKVIGEGANLGITQAARIEFAEHGGRINTDFIDNSAGVDCSDNEVNIKIPLNREMSEGRLTFEKRNKLLAKMTDEVAEHRARG